MESRPRHTGFAWTATTIKRKRKRTFPEETSVTIKQGAHIHDRDAEFEKAGQLMSANAKVTRLQIAIHALNKLVQELEDLLKGKT